MITNSQFLFQISASLRELNKKVVEKRQGYARSVLLLLLLLFCILLFALADSEPEPCSCVKKPVNTTISWTEQFLACDVDFQFEVFGGLVACKINAFIISEHFFISVIVFGQSPSRKISSIPHLFLLVISAAVHHLLLDYFLPSSDPLKYTFVALCFISCGILLSKPLPENEKPRKEGQLFFSKLRKNW